MTDGRIQKEWDAVIKAAAQSSASDIILACGGVYFKRGSESLARVAVLQPEIFSGMLECVDAENRLVKRKHTLDGSAGASDFSWECSGRRFRVNKYKSSCGLCLAMRPLSEKIPTMEELEFSPKVKSVLEKVRQGLVIMTGPTGSGKSTSLASMVEFLNSSFALNIVTVEDPIEYVYSPKLSLVTQREIGGHVGDFKTAVRSAMRQSPDVILVGEVRDYETLKACLRAAETGHLVLTTLHTKGVASTIMRMLDMAPGNERQEVASMLSYSYQMIIYQKLLFAGGRYVTLREILMPHAGARNCIKTGNPSGVENIIQMSRELGMQCWKGDVEEKLRSGRIGESVAKTMMAGD